MSATPDDRDDSVVDRAADFRLAVEDADAVPATNVRIDADGVLTAVEFRLEDVDAREDAKDLARIFGFAEAEYRELRERDDRRPGRVAFHPTAATVRFVTARGGL